MVSTSGSSGIVGSQLLDPNLITAPIGESRQEHVGNQTFIRAVPGNNLDFAIPGAFSSLTGWMVASAIGLGVAIAVPSES